MGLCVKFQLPKINSVQVMDLQNFAKNGHFWAVIKKTNLAQNDLNKIYYISIISIFKIMYRIGTEKCLPHL